MSGPAPSLSTTSSAFLQHVTHDWPEFAATRAPARALSHKTRLFQTTSIAANEVRVALALALLSHDCGTCPPTAVSSADEAQRAAAVKREHQLYAHARAIVTDRRTVNSPCGRTGTCLRPRSASLATPSEALSGDARWSTAPQLAPAQSPISPPRLKRQQFGQSVHLFLAAVGQGRPLADGLRAFGGLGLGHFSHDDRCFIPRTWRSALLAIAAPSWEGL